MGIKPHIYRAFDLLATWFLIWKCRFTNIFYTIYCKGTNNNPVNKEGGDTNARKHSQKQVQGGSLAPSGDDRKLSEGERYFWNSLAR